MMLPCSWQANAWHNKSKCIFAFVRLFEVTENWNYTYQKGRSNKERQSDWITLSYLSKIYYRIFDTATNEVVGQQNLLIDLSWLTALRLGSE